MWNDACGVTSEWEDVEQVKAFRYPIRTVGWLMKSTKHAITVAASVGGQYDYPKACGAMTIPRGCITRIRRLPGRCAHRGKDE